MTKTSANSDSNKFTTYLFGISVTALILFNVYVTVGTRYMSHSVKTLHAEIDVCEDLAQQLKALRGQYDRESYVKIEAMEKHLKQTHQQLQDEDNLFPVLDREFVVLTADAGPKNEMRNVHLTVPKVGQHQLRIQMNHRKQQLLDRQFDLDSGRGYRISFILEDDQIRLLFPDQQPIATALENFVSDNHITNLRISIFGQSTFVSCNQPRWRVQKQSDEIEEQGLLSQFAFMSQSHEPDEHVTIKISASSDGPPSASVDDPATVQYLYDQLGYGNEPKFRYEGGRYIFE